MKCIKYVLGLLFLIICDNVGAQPWKQYVDSANVYQDKGNLEKAISYRNKVREESIRDSMWTVDFALNSGILANLYFDVEELKKSESFHLEAKLIREKILGKESRPYSNSCHNLARLYDRIGQYEKAESLYIEARQIREKVLGKEHFDYASTCNNLAIVYMSKGQYDKAEPLYIEAKQIREKIFGKEHVDYVHTCHNLGVLYINTRQYDKAEPLYVEAKRIREKITGKEHPDYVAICNNLGLLYFNTAMYEKAELEYTEAKQIREKIFGKEHPDYLQSCFDLGKIYAVTAQYDKVEPLMIEIKQTREKVLGKEHPDYAASCTMLGTVYMAIGHYGKAETFYMEARTVWGKSLGKEHVNYILSCTNMGSLYINMGLYEKAEFYFIEAKQIIERTLGKENTDYANNCNGLGVLYLNTYHYEKAEPFLIEALRVREKILGRSHPDYASSCDNLGVLYCNMGLYDKALPLSLEARQIREKFLGKYHFDYALSCTNLGVLYWYLLQNENADTALLEAKEIQKKLFGIGHDLYTKSCYNLASFYWNMGEVEKSQSYFSEAFQSLMTQYKRMFLFTSEKEQEKYLKMGSRYDWIYLSFITSIKTGFSKREAYDQLLAQRSLILSSSRQLRSTVYNSTDTLIMNKYKSWLSAREQQAFWLSKPVNERNKRDSLFEEKGNALEKELVLFSTTYKKAKEEMNITYENIKQKLLPGEASIEFSSFQYNDGKRWTDSTYYIGIVLRKDKSEPELVKLFEEKELNELLKIYKSTSAGQVQLSFLYKKGKIAGKDLYDLIWKPLETKLEGIKTIYFAPAGSLFKISFAALPVNENEVLSDKYKLVQLNTTASIASGAVAGLSISDKIMLYGGVHYDVDSASMKQLSKQTPRNGIVTPSIPGELLRDAISEFKFLEGTSTEINGIRRLAEENNYVIAVAEGNNATEESFKSVNGRKSPAVVHIATHGFFFPDPRNSKKDNLADGAMVFQQSDNPLFRSGLALAGANNAWKGKPVDGVEDGILTAYEVSNMYLPNTKLAILSACETGLGDIQGREGVYGLQRAFKIAGVENLVMSLWKVPDTETAEFMQELYKNLFAKETIQDAFFNAQSLLKSKYRNDPYKWAAWVLIR